MLALPGLSSILSMPFAFSPSSLLSRLVDWNIFTLVSRFVFGCLFGFALPRSLLRGTLYHLRSLIDTNKLCNNEVSHGLGESFGAGHCPWRRCIGSRPRQRAGRRSCAGKERHSARQTSRCLLTQQGSNLKPFELTELPLTVVFCLCHVGLRAQSDGYKIARAASFDVPAV